MNKININEGIITINNMEYEIEFRNGYHGEYNFTFNDNQMIVVNYCDIDDTVGAVVFKFKGDFYVCEYCRSVTPFGGNAGKETVDTFIAKIGDEDKEVESEMIESFVKDIFEHDKKIGDIIYFEFV